MSVLLQKILLNVRMGNKFDRYKKNSVIKAFELFQSKCRSLNCIWLMSDTIFIKYSLDGVRAHPMLASHRLVECFSSSRCRLYMNNNRHYHSFIIIVHEGTTYLSHCGIGGNYRGALQREIIVFVDILIGAPKETLDIFL